MWRSIVIGYEKYLALAAVVIDKLIGDPRSFFHPVVLIGNFIALLERLLLRREHSAAHKKVAGFVLVITVLTITYLLVWGLMYILAAIHWLAELIGGAIILSFAITPRSLAEAGSEIKALLESGNLEQARSKVGWIVGRDTAKMDVSEATRATVETVAENIVDGIISPLFYFVVGGVPLAFLYRAVNTMDSMVGYKNEKYLNFGMAAARTDDVFNYVPARLTGILIIFAALLLGYNAKGAAKAIRRDAAKHPSPNSGISEAGIAGALGIRLGGLNYYGGIASFRAYMGDERAILSPNHISQTIKLMYIVTGLFLILALIVKS